MKILGLPTIPVYKPSGGFDIVPCFRHNEFLIWIADTEKLATAKLWARVLSDRANAEWLDYRDILQTIFEQKYLAFCVAKGYPADEVMFDNKPDNTDAVNRSNYRHSQRASKKLVMWDVINTPKAHSREQICEHKADSEILSYEGIMKSFGGFAASASPERQQEEL